MDRRAALSCCAPAYGKVFGSRGARRAADRYRRKGLDGDARWLVGEARARAPEAATVLELGGGVGSLHVDLLRGGAASAVNVELSPEWEAAAAELLREHGLADRVERRVADAVEDGDALEEADVVVMNRVVCCYPDPDALMRVAAGRARHLLLVSFPHDRPAVRLWVRLLNTWLAVRGIAFRSYVHPEPVIESAAERRGLHPVSERRGAIWRAVVFART